MFKQFLVQISAILTPTPTDAALASAAASPSPTTTPTSSRALHVVLEQQPSWNSALSIFLVIAIAIVAGLVIGLIAQKGGVSSFIGKLFADFTNVLAYVVVTFAYLGSFVIAWRVIRVGGAQPEKNPVIQKATDP
jgi:hypothetical protein